MLAKQKSHKGVHDIQRQLDSTIVAVNRVVVQNNLAQLDNDLNAGVWAVRDVAEVVAHLQDGDVSDHFVVTQLKMKTNMADKNELTLRVPLTIESPSTRRDMTTADH